MREIYIEFIDGSQKIFHHESRPGGSWSLKAEYKPDWLIITDCWENVFSYPLNQIKFVRAIPLRNF